MKEATEEIRNRKTEAPKNMRKENNKFVSSLMRKRLPHRSTPMNHFSRLKKMTLNQIQKVGVGALTRFPPMDLRLTNTSLVHLPLRSRSLRRHWNESLSPHAQGLAVASFSRHSRARADEFCGGGERRGSVLNLDLPKQLNKQRQGQYGKKQEVQKA